ncbi:MAG: tRNA (adenosine(37)-N6)-threonylcarbamoyltransferase complex dimerization subunit type 1 TsaB [Candidatus Kerfeldbacteria bacterium CG08_land_8_20_14_0_20_40_16]|uniref:tRNA (Adenosine(37)-N6)-threonylcarbamoyltransferase complex dimerization subunit type 1 TsaB n=1 Tax=Candidatus Kerfeldbacteria bacterium CG08_land_8_20_14_0_20_40_16 TaxID=2014244 RepID=A0A2H0YXY0_9BACT|nr:MAG: tRNA (adenosine(37)-N6)-threonylcarbamoyltransferase complex dimerization subunit type 1 TsaB [Candidatus Kerfeldbacteria bacterium CG08_land_8_20_14_0_20_40_16]
MNIIINTSVQNQTTIVLDGGGLFYSHSFSSEFHQSEELLKEIDLFLKKKKVSLKALKGIGVVLGPGPFTALRMGVVAANTLGYALNIKTAGLKQNKFKTTKEMVERFRSKFKKARGFKILEPFYGRTPNITKSKKK